MGCVCCLGTLRARGPAGGKRGLSDFRTGTLVVCPDFGHVSKSDTMSSYRTVSESDI